VLVCGANLHLMQGLVAGLGARGIKPRLEITPGQCCVVFRPGRKVRAWRSLGSIPTGTPLDRERASRDVRGALEHRLGGLTAADPGTPSTRRRRCAQRRARRRRR
jgi:hypothetical protein